MLPTLRPGRIVWATPLIKPTVGSIVIATHDGIEIIKRVRTIENGSIYLYGDNHADTQNAVIEREQLIGTVLFL